MTGRESKDRGLIVLADGGHAAFAAAAVAAMSAKGQRWSWGLGAGLGAQVAVLALLGEAQEAERRWRRQVLLGVPLLRSRLEAAASRLGHTTGVRVSADPWSLDGWLDPASLAEHLAPEAAGIPGRLRAAGVRCGVCIEDLNSGSCGSVELAALEAADASELLVCTACFPAGWGPRVQRPGGAIWWGGVAAAILPAIGDGGPVDVVCGFPFPSTGRPAAGGSLLEALQAREEVRVGRMLGEWLGAAPAGKVTTVAPTAAAYARVVERTDADLGLEYPLPWERNGELLGLVMDLGTAAGAAAVD